MSSTKYFIFGVNTNHKKQSSSEMKKKKKKYGVVVKQSAGFIRRIARLPAKDRKEVLKILKKQGGKRRALSKASKGIDTNVSNNSNSSTSSVNKELENWVVLHGRKEVMEDVREIGKALGVQYGVANNNRFNLLTREGRREWRAERGTLVAEGEVAGSEVGGEGK
jgi:hypothetical protein